MNPVFYLFQALVLYHLVRAIYGSQRRWLSVGYAVLGLVAFGAISLTATAILGKVYDGDDFTTAVVSTNKFIDMLGWFQFVPSLIGAAIPPRRK